MFIKATESISNTSTTATIEHNGRRLIFSISVYRRPNFSENNNKHDVFEQINEYWASRPEPIQQAIFDVYNRIHDLSNDVSIGDKQEHKARLKQCVTELFSYHDLDKVQMWAFTRCKSIQIPTSIKEEFVADRDRNITMDRTYIAYDYRQLVALSLVLRSMIPIWGDYIYSIRSESNDVTREMQAFQLVEQVLTPDLPVMTKLITYIEAATVSSANNRSIGVLKGIPTSDYPRWFLSKIIVRSLPIADIRGSNPNAHLASGIHNVVNSIISDKKGPGDNIKSKEISDDNNTDNSGKSTVLERYKIKAVTAVGDVVEYEYFMFDTLKTALKLSKTVTDEEVIEAVTRARELHKHVTKPQVNLMQWVLKPVCTMVLLLPEATLIDMIGVCEAVLWSRGHHYLSILLSCVSVVAENEMVVGAVDSKTRIPEPLLCQLDELFPYKRMVKNTKTGIIEVNTAVENIDNLTKSIMQYGWRPTASQDRVEKITNRRMSRLQPKSDIRTDMANLVIELEKGEYLPTPVIPTASNLVSI